MAELRGTHVLAVAVGAFGIIIAVNVTLAVQAVRTFPGLEVANSYVASQEFDARRKAQEALGWTVTAGYDGTRARVSFTDAQGAPVQVRDLAVLIGRTTETSDDVTPGFAAAGSGYVAEVPLAKGVWMLRITARAQDGTAFQKRIDIVVEG